MTPHSDDPEFLITHLSWRPKYLVEASICISETIPPGQFQGIPESASIGHLDVLSTDLLHLVLASLDFRSLSNLACVSHGGRAAVESLPAYQRLIKNAPAALIALSRTKLITCHSIASIYAALLTEKCVSCHHYGPFLFLPTCERCCIECLVEDRSFSVVSRLMAGFCFGVTLGQLRQIPAMLSLPELKLREVSKRRKPVTVVSVKQAKELGLAIHGSQEAMEHFTNSRNAAKLSYFQENDFQRLTRPLIERFPYRNKFSGTASIAFPTLRRDGGLDKGLWCLGCFVCWDEATEPFPKGGRALSNTGFVRHVSECKGAKSLLQKMEVDAFYDPRRDCVYTHMHRDEYP